MVASVGPEALVALHEYINGGTEESVRELVRQAAQDGDAESVHGVYRSEIQLDLVKNYQYQIYIISLKSKTLIV